MLKGRIARSAAGRDKNEWLVIVGEQNGEYLVCNGKDRPLERPKRKNPRHLELTDDSLPTEGIKTNRALRTALAQYDRAQQTLTHSEEVFSCQKKM